MKQSLEAHASRFDEVAATYDDEQNDTPEYRACVSLVVDAVRDGLDGGEETVLDVGCGTGAIALAVADDAGRVIGRDISDGMLERGREKAAEENFEHVSFGTGRFREPNVPADANVDVVASNFAMHHLSDDEKRDAIEVLAGLEPRRVVLGDVMLFGEADPDEPFYSPEVDDPATVGVLVEAFTDAGFVVTDVTAVHDQVGVIVADDPSAVSASSAGSSR
jgi:SAM-dependent methyltransferase